MNFGHRIRVQVTGSRRVTVECIDGVGPTIRVKLQRGGQSKGDKAQVTIYGLDEGFLEPLLVPGATCTVSAGLGQLGGLTSGRIVKGSYAETMEGTDRVVTWSMLDGRATLQAVTVSRSWDSVDSGTVWRYLAEQSGLTLGTLRPGATVQFDRGYMVASGWRAAADRLAKATGSSHTVQSGVLHVWPIGETLQARRLVLGDRQIVGDPATIDGGRIKVSTVYTGQPCNPGDTWRMDIPRFRGVWRSQATEWDLSSGRDEAFYMTMTGVRA